jgi:dolichyl-phosphate-mannose-protein mannosyltransferase
MASQGRSTYRGRADDRFGGDANDDFVVEIAPKTKAGTWDWAAKHRLRTLRSQFRLRHAMTGCYLFSHKVKLPDWGFEQQEVSVYNS